MVSTDRKKLVIPGDRLGSVKDLIAGENTFVENDIIYSSCAGEVKKAKGNRKISVSHEGRAPDNILAGDDLICQVEDVQGNIARCRILLGAGEDRGTHPYDLAYLHLSKISPSYVESMNDMIRINDILRARVTSAEPVIEITTLFEEYGVIYSTCPACRVGLRASRPSILRCPECGEEVRKKAAIDYGEGKETRPEVDRSYRFPQIKEER